MADDHRTHTVAPVVAVLTAVLSMQFGAALAATLFDRVGALGTVTLRLLFAAVVLCVITRPRLRTWRPEQWRAVVTLGASLALMNTAFYGALTRLPLAATVTIEFLGPLGLAAFLSRRVRDALWVVLALTGVVLLGVGDGAGLSTGLDPVGVAFALVAASGWAWYIVAGSRVATTLPGSAGTAGATAIAAVVVLPFGAATAGTELLRPDLVLAGLAVALLSSAIPYTLEIRALRDLSKEVFAILIALEPAAAALAGVVVLGQLVEPLALVGIALVVIASIGALRTSRT
ncbi:EamA family transporter [Rhodococcus gordoniae]|uniref:EamA family transporter n=1 Tax=Rhodococcus gordoniae TaxID=223392 RepID=UPI0020CE6E6C|nr:EamA family transporter [Rhodococcus gordoniae]UTT47686.1 EamA family transporter [Rhodococcus gordoniae]